MLGSPVVWRPAFAALSLAGGLAAAEARADEPAGEPVAGASASRIPVPPPSSAPVPTPIDGLGEDLARAFTGTNLIFYGVAVGETIVMSASGGDHAVRVWVRRNFAVDAWGDSAVVLGYVLPAVVAPGLWAVGLVSRERWALGAGSAAVQALATTMAVTVLLKRGTGRPYPLNGGDPNAPDVLEHPENARIWKPFRVDGGWAWPSGHTAGLTSVVAAVSAWDPEQIAIPLIGYPIALAIGAGMVIGDHHWTSDVIAGGLIGNAIGSSVGDSFRRRERGARPAARSLRVVPLAGATQGAAIVGTW